MLALVGLTLNIGTLFAQQEYWWIVARKHVIAENFEQANTFYNQAVAVYPANGLLRAEYAYSLQKAGQLERAIDEYYLAIGLSGIQRDEIRTVKFNIAHAYAELQDYDMAFSAFSELADKHLDFSEVFLNRANVGIVMQNYRSAKSDYEYFLEREPDTILKEDILSMLALLESYTTFPTASVDKEAFDAKIRFEEELNKRLNYIEQKQLRKPNSFLGEEAR